MVRKDDSKIIEVVHSVCCGLDVHKDKVSAYLIFHDAKGNEQSDVKEFGTFTDDLIRMREWLLAHEGAAGHSLSSRVIAAFDLFCN